MIVLIAGVALFIAAHVLKRLAPGLRDMLGKGGVAALLVVSVVLMIWGYRSAGLDPVYAPPSGMGHLNNMLMLISIFLFGVGGTKGALYTRMRHPMLWGTVIWSVSHLLVNGDVASLVLFGGLGLWSVLEMVLINAAGPWARPAAVRGIKGDAMNAVGTLVLYGLIAAVHIWLGHNPFLGTYG